MKLSQIKVNCTSALITKQTQAAGERRVGDTGGEQVSSQGGCPGPWALAMGPALSGVETELVRVRLQLWAEDPLRQEVFLSQILVFLFFHQQAGFAQEIGKIRGVVVAQSLMRVMLGTGHRRWIRAGGCV